MKLTTQVRRSLNSETWMKNCSMMTGCRNEVYYGGEGKFNERDVDEELQ